MKMNKKSRFSSFIGIQHIFFFEVSIGIMANTVLLLFHVFTFILEHRPKPTDMTIGHLSLIHVVMLLTSGFIAIDIFGYKDFVNDITCKSVLYLYRLMRGLSVCTTSHLSVLQTITLSPRSSYLAKFKQNSLNQNLYCFLFLWVFNALISGPFSNFTVAISNVTSHSFIFLTQSCSLLPIRSFIKYISLSLMTFQHMSFIGLMALSSVYMVSLLCRHKRQSQHLYSTSHSPKASAEQRATRTILLLMSFFTAMYILDCVIESIPTWLWNHDPVRHCVHMLIGSGYATLSPLVLISTERRMIKCFVFMWQKHSKCLFKFHDG
ncbi:vomeronasal type-1 receptor 90-like [Fukomys damarensis]|uniref:vomeronasal type-1 receptor 90-like n=1 Tax=Fukomys damarensis TaxID=885580 RepID=UPI0008FEB91A|nr:vomeronasal type-1 receptor 90-like [Fukomys damarensis]